MRARLLVPVLIVSAVVGWRVLKGSTGDEGRAAPDATLRLENRSWVDREIGGGERAFVHRFTIVVHHPKDRDDMDDAGWVWLERYSSYEHHLSRGGFEILDKERIRVTLKQDGKRHDVRYRVYACSKGQYDVCLDVEGLPLGPKTFYSNDGMKRSPERNPKS